MPGMSGAGSRSKIIKDPERGYERDLEAVPGTFNQDLLPYRASFLGQHRERLVLMGATLLILSSPWALTGDWGNVFMALLVSGGAALVLVLRWWLRYLHTEEMLADSGVALVSHERQDGELAALEASEEEPAHEVNT